MRLAAALGVAVPSIVRGRGQAGPLPAGRLALPVAAFRSHADDMEIGTFVNRGVAPVASS